MRADRLYSIVVPVYRSEAYLAATVRELLAFFGPRSPVEVILVNDGSPDGVQRVIDDLCAGDARVRSLLLAKNAGQHRATLFGLREARGDVVVTIDDDAQNPPSAALAVVETLEREDLDVVYGKFDVTGRPWSRRVAPPANLEGQLIAQSNLYDLALQSEKGKTISLSDYKGKKILIVNTASACGYTPQYEGLEALYQKYKDHLVIVGFPANNFGGQEPGTNAEIAEFCTKMGDCQRPTDSAKA